MEEDKVNQCRSQPQRIVAVALLCALTCAGCSSAKPDPVCEAFMQLKNAKDAAADDLLGPLPPVPSDPVTEEEADRLDTDYVLHSPLYIIAVRPDTAASVGKPSRCVLVVKGTFSCRPLRVRGSESHSQRHLVNPDLIVEVRDGKLYGVRAQVHPE
jgi:hypothetical protein